MSTETTVPMIDMVREGIGDPIQGIACFGRHSDLLAAMWTGHKLDQRMKTMGDAHADLVIGGTHDARCLRLYLAEIGGHLRGINTLEAAETAMGIRDDRGMVKGEWR